MTTTTHSSSQESLIYFNVILLVLVLYIFNYVYAMLSAGARKSRAFNKEFMDQFHDQWNIYFPG